MGAYQRRYFSATAPAGTLTTRQGRGAKQLPCNMELSVLPAVAARSGTLRYTVPAAPMSEKKCAIVGGGITGAVASSVLSHPLHSIALVKPNRYSSVRSLRGYS